MHNFHPSASKQSLLVSVALLFISGAFLAAPSNAEAVIVGLEPLVYSPQIFDATGQAFVKELGAHSIRIANGHGNRDFGVNWAAQNGIGVMFNLGYGLACDAKTPAGRQCYADRSAGLVRTFGNKVQYWEIWNEWNGLYGPYGRSRTLNQPRFAEYADLLCRTYRAVKAVSPNAKVVGGATDGSDLAWNGKMLDAGGKNCLDAISVHLYVYTPKAFSVPPNAPGSVAAAKFAKAIAAVNNLVRQKMGKSIPILVTEEGRRDDGTVANQQITADYITELFKRAPSMPFLAGVWWFHLEDTGKGSGVGGLGLLRSNNTKKPSFAAFQAAAKGTNVPVQ